MRYAIHWNGPWHLFAHAEQLGVLDEPYFECREVLKNWCESCRIEFLLGGMFK